MFNSPRKCVITWSKSALIYIIILQQMTIGIEMVLVISIETANRVQWKWFLNMIQLFIEEHWGPVFSAKKRSSRSSAMLLEFFKCLMLFKIVGHLLSILLPYNLLFRHPLVMWFGTKKKKDCVVIMSNNILVKLMYSNKFVEQNGRLEIWKRNISMCRVHDKY